MIVSKFNRYHALLLLSGMMLYTSCFECARADTICPSKLVIISSQNLSSNQPSDSNFVLEQISEMEYQIEFVRAGMHELLLKNEEIATIDVTFTDPSDSFSCCDSEVGIERLTFDGLELCDDFISCMAIEI